MPDPSTQHRLIASQRRSGRGLQRMAGGSIDGRSDQAAPLPERPTGRIYQPPSVGQRGAQVLVAASNAMDETIESADYRCDGSADEVEINLAIAEVAAAGGGVVQLSEGGFDTADDIDMVDQYGVSLVGRRAQTTIIAGAADIRVAGIGINLADFTFEDGNVVIDYWLQESWITRLEMEGGILCAGSDRAVWMTHITDCVVDSGINLGATGTGELWRVTIAGNDADGGIQIDCKGPSGGSFAGWVTVANNRQLTADSWLKNGRYCSWVGNSGYADLDLDTLVEAVASGNVMGRLHLINGDLVTVTGNTIECQGDIDLSGCVDCIFSDNVIASFHGASHDAIVTLSSNCDRCKVSDNLIRRRGSAPTADYAIRINAASDSNMVTNNDGFDSWDTAAVLDTGSGNTVAGNR